MGAAQRSEPSTRPAQAIFADELERSSAGGGAAAGGAQRTDVVGDMFFHQQQAQQAQAQQAQARAQQRSALSVSSPPAQQPQGATPSGFVIPADAIWSYLDPKGNIQGPFRTSQMRNWHERHYFTDALPMRVENSAPEMRFTPMNVIFPRLENAFLPQRSPRAADARGASNFGGSDASASANANANAMARAQQVQQQVAAEQQQREQQQREQQQREQQQREQQQREQQHLAAEQAAEQQRKAAAARNVWGGAPVEPPAVPRVQTI